MFLCLGVGILPPIIFNQSDPYHIYLIFQGNVEKESGVVVHINLFTYYLFFVFVREGNMEKGHVKKSILERYFSATNKYRMCWERDMLRLYF